MEGGGQGRGEAARTSGIESQEAGSQEAGLLHALVGDPPFSSAHTL